MTPTPRAFSRPAAAAAPVLIAVLAACSASAASEGAPSHLSISTPDSTTPEIGDAVRLVVRAVYLDGSSRDVTGQARCTIGDPAPGVLAGDVFTAERPGTAEVACELDGAVGTLSITVRGALDATAADLQRGDVPVGTRVAVEVIVTAVDAGDYVDFWAQDPGGGAYSGLTLRDVRTAAGDAVAEATRVRAEGVVEERDGRTVVSYDAVETLGPATPTIDVVAIADLDAERWDGALVAVEDVEVTAEVVDTYFWEVAAIGDLDGARVLIDTLLHDPAPYAGDRFDRIVGPFDVFDDGTTVSTAIVPRRADDVVAAP